MHTSRTPSAAQALYRVFVLPTLSQSQSASLRCSARHQLLRSTPRKALCRQNRRAFSVQAPYHAKNSAPEVRTEKWDDEITARRIYLVDPATNELYKDPRTGQVESPRFRSEVLKRLDKSTHRLVQPSQQGADMDDLNFIPVCKIISKKEAFDHEKRKKAKQKEARKMQTTITSLKTLELNWAIDANDLSHRLERVQEFLAEGRKLEVILASKKRGRKATPSECEEVLQKIRKTVDSVNGAKEMKAMEGKVGGFVTLFFQGRVPQQQAKEG